MTIAGDVDDTAPGAPPPAAARDGFGDRHRGREVALQVLYALDLYETGRRDARIARSEDPKRERDEAESEFASLSALEIDVLPEDSVEAASLVFGRITEHFVVPRSAIAFARELVAAVAARTADLDEIIGLHARNWRVARMAAVDRNVLRLAVYELRDTATPVAVVIDEAVDLARRFGSETSPAFVNGVLDAVAREVRAA